MPTAGTRLFVPGNLGAFDQQLNAVYRLKDGPLPHHRGLLMLCEDPSRARWPPVSPVSIAGEHWFLLGDASWDGTAEQREFLEKALGTLGPRLPRGPTGLRQDPRDLRTRPATHRP